MNKNVSVSVIHDKFYNAKSFIMYDGSETIDCFGEVSSYFLNSLFDTYEKVIVFDIKDFTNFLHVNGVKLENKQISKIESIRLLLNIKDSNNKNIDIPSVLNSKCKLSYYYKKIESFKKIYGTNYASFAPVYITDSYCKEEAKEIFNIYEKEYVEDEYYQEIKRWLYYLGKCELNGIKVKEKCKIENIENYVYPVYEYDATYTGRIINDIPFSFQNLAKDDERRLCFKSRFDGGKFLTADYDSADLRVAFAVSGQETKTDDLHSYIAKKIFDQDEITPEYRKKIKEMNFGLIYGASAKLLSKKLETNEEDIENMTEKFFSLFPNIRSFMINNRDFAIKNGYVKSFFGRKRILEKSDVTKFFNSVIQMTTADMCYRTIYHLQDAFEKLEIKSKLIPFIVYDKIAIDLHPGEETKVEILVHDNMSYEAPGELHKIVNFPIKIEFSENL